MSNAGTQNTSPEVVNEALDAFISKWDKRKKVIARVTDDQPEFQAFVEATFNDTNPYVDWASSAAATLGDGLTLIMVETDETGENRLIAAASKENFLKDEIVVENLYRIYLNRLASQASKPDSVADMFATVSGVFKPRFDLAAFKDHAKDVVKFLHSKGLHGITVPTLKVALSNSAFATAQFPQMKPEQWKIIFAIMMKNAEDAGQDTSILKHWANTRDAMTDAGGEVGFGQDDFAAFLAEEDEGSTAQA